MPPQKVKLISGFIFKEEAVYKQAKTILGRHFGRIDFESQALPFLYTDYYQTEFGSPLKRKFVSFYKLILPQNLARIKITTRQIEKKLSLKAKRRINIDPGYLNLAKLILASTKDYKHRIYIKDGIYAEVTLFYQHKTFQTWPWTYPDYRSREYIGIFNQIRNIYQKQIA